MIERILNFAVGSFTIGNLLAAVIIFAVGWIVCRYVLRFTSKTLVKSRLDKTLVSFVQAVIKAVVYFMLVVIVADCLNISAASLVAVFSVAGLSLSLAAESSLSNLAGGVMLLVLKPFEVGDYVEAAGSGGTVKELGLFYTEMITLENKHVFVPNKDISSSNIVNFTREDVRRIEFKILISYADSIEKVRQVIVGAVTGVEGVLCEPEPPYARVNAYEDSGIEYTVRAWCKTENYWSVYYDCLEITKLALDKNGITIPYKHVNVHILEK